jgi:predicted nucleic acid-binding Zn ribbon protein
MASGREKEIFQGTLCLLAFRFRRVEPFRVKPSPGKTPWRGPGKGSARARILAQWRGVDNSAQEKARAVVDRSVADVLPSLLKELRIDARQGEAEIVKVWNSTIDPNITAHAQPANLAKGTLFVNVDSSVWLSEIVRYRRKEILDRLQNSFGKTLIQKISFRVGSP